MSQWAKIKFYYETMLGSTGSALTATSTASGDYSAAYLYNMLEINRWMSADTASPHYISYDAGAGNAKSADYLAVLGHNLKSAGATAVLQYSSDGVNYNDAFTAFSPQSDAAVLKEFASPGAYRYWRLKMTGMTAPVYMAVCIWGNATELDYATASFDPHEQDVKANVNLSYGGYVSGIHTQYTERTMSINFDDSDAALYSAVRQWWESSGLKNFFVAWESANSPEDVFLMRPDTKFSNPLKAGGAYRNITINLKGRKE